MEVTLQSTTRVVDLLTERLGVTIKARVWEGTTESGIKVQALIPRICASSAADLSEFERDLQECEPPREEAPVFPLRMIL